MRGDLFTIGSLMVLAKDGNLEAFMNAKQHLHLVKDVFADDKEYPCEVINTPYLTTKSPNGRATHPDQEKFKQLTEDFMTNLAKKSLVLRSRYGSGKTTFMQRLIRERNPERVLFITYRQTLARDIMRNFGQLGFKNYLDSYEDPRVWESPRLIVQLDSLLNVVLKNDSVVSGSGFELSYGLIVLDESESLLCHFDEKTMEKKEIDIWSFFDELLKHCKKMVLMDGDVSERTLSFASSYGRMVYVNNTNTEQNKTINLICDSTKWETQLHGDLEKFYQEDKGFRVVVVSQSSTQALGLEEELKEKYPHFQIKRLVGLDSGGTKRSYLEDINRTLETANVFIYSPVIESGVDITIPVKKIYGILSCKSNSQRAYLQMLARCRNVEDGRMDILNDFQFKINNNYCFWRYKEVLELNAETVNHGFAFEVEGGVLRLSEKVDVRRKTISVFNTVERLNKHPSLFVNYLKTLAMQKGLAFTVDETSMEKPPSRQNYNLNAIQNAVDISQEEFERLNDLKKQGKTTTDENFQVDKHFWQRYLLQKELSDELLKEFMYDNNPLDNFLALIDERNHRREDNLRSAKLLERARLVKEMVLGLGFASVVDREKIDRETFVSNFAESVASSPNFQNHKRLNELFDMRKNRSIDKDMNPRMILPWTNMLLKPFGLCVKADHGKYKLEERVDLRGLIQRKNKVGKYFVDGENLLGQKKLLGADLFLDEETGEVRRKKGDVLDTSGLDKGIKDEED